MVDAATNSEALSVVDLGRRARAASRVLATASSAAKNEVLLTAADLLGDRAADVVAANAVDLEAAAAAGMAAGPLWQCRSTAPPRSVATSAAREVSPPAATPLGCCDEAM